MLLTELAAPEPGEGEAEYARGRRGWQRIGRLQRRDGPVLRMAVSARRRRLGAQTVKVVRFAELADGEGE